MNKKISVLILLNIIILNFSLAKADFSGDRLFLHIKRITVEQGLAQSTVKSIVEDKLGFLWFGTDEGLSRYDGYKIINFKHDPDDPNSLGDKFVNTLLSDSTGKLWIGTGKGLSRYDFSSERFFNYSHIKTDPDTIGSDIINCLCESEDKRLWIAGNSNILNLYLKGSDKFKSYEIPCSILQNKKTTILTICEIKNGELWIGTSNSGIIVFHQQKRRFEHLSKLLFDRSDKRYYKIRSIYKDNSGMVWVGTSHHGLFLWNEQEEKFQKFNLKDGSKTISSEFEITSICQDKKGRIWFGSFGSGIGIYYPDSRKIILHIFKDEEENFNEIRKIYRSNTGILWFGTQGGGVYFHDPDKEALTGHHLFPKVLKNISIASVYKSREGFLWIGTSNKGLYGLDNQYNIKYHFSTASKGSYKIHHNQVTALCQDKDGSLWIGTYGQGLYNFNMKTHKTIHYTYDPKDPSSISSHYIVCMLTDCLGTLWIGTHDGDIFKGGLNKFNKQTKTFTRFLHEPDNPQSISYNGINCIFEQSPDILWVGTFRGGLNRFDKRKKTFKSYTNIKGVNTSLSNNCVTSICMDQNKELWVGTLYGLNKMNTEKGDFKRLLESDGLHDNTVYSVVKEGDSRLWIGTNTGISKLNIRNFAFVGFTTADGLCNREYNMGAYHISTKGEVFFGGINGVDYIQPKNIKDDPEPPKVVITGLSIYNKLITATNSPYLERSIMETSRIVLPYTANHLSITFTALNYSLSDKYQYSYRLQGNDREWITKDAGYRFVSYTNLDPGIYTFNVKASNQNGVWNHEGAKLEIRINSPFWLTWWFQTGSIIIFIFFSYFTVGFLRKHLKLIAFWKQKKYIGPYRIDRQIGSGGTGVVYKVRRISKNSECYAMKLLKEECLQNETYKKRFRNESKIIDQIDHPNVVKIFDRGEVNGRDYIVMELLNGKTLAMKIHENSEMDIKEIIRIVVQVCGGLEELHTLGILHRDLKPENIFLVENTPTTIKLLDFGLARTEVSNTRLTETGQIVGTIAYIPPEIISGKKVSSAGDIYSLGVILYEMLTGKNPFIAETSFEMFKMILKNNFPDLTIYRKDIPQELIKLTQAMTDQNPVNRPKASEIIQQLLLL